MYCHLQDFLCVVVDVHGYQTWVGSSTLVVVLKYNKYSPSQYLQSI